MLRSYVDYFIPETIRGNADEYRRSFQLTAFTQLSLLFFIPNVIKWFNMGYPGLAASIFSVTVLVFLGGPLMIKYTGSLRIMGNFIIAALAWHFTVLPAVTGGILSTSLAWNMVIPVFAVTFVGFRSFLFWTGIMFLVIMSFTALHFTGYNLPTIHLTDAQIVQTNIANVIGPFLTMGIALSFGDRGLKNALAAHKAAAHAHIRAEQEQEALREKSDLMARQLESIFLEVSESSQHLVEDAVKELAELARKANENAADTNDLMGQIGMVVAETNQSMKQLTSQMADISRTSEETSKIIRTIDEIAFQTNLLALNAAVEAARAGESGAGFAVVAEEVRNLAMRSAEAARNTSVLIEDVIRLIRQGSDLAVKTDDSFARVAVNVTRAVSLVNEITASSSTQSKGIENVNTIAARINVLVTDRVNA